MPDHKTIYQQYALQYQRLVGREDYQNQLVPALQRIAPLQDCRVVETGAGTGRLTCLLAPYAASLCAFDISAAMLAVAGERLRQSGHRRYQLGVADHRRLPVASGCADLALSGWSVAYLVDWGAHDWRAEVAAALTEMQRVVRPGGSIVIIETQGTGCETPHAPEKLLPYYAFLESHGFSSAWIRTDYQFASLEEALELTGFFFGEELADQVRSAHSPILPECTGLWWRQRP